MLGKLMKYDLKEMLRSISVFYILSIFFAILVRIFASVDQTFAMQLIDKICVGCMVSMIFSSLINVIIRSWVRFKATLYGDESYLTHTLPISKRQIYSSKFWLMVINTLICFAVITVSLIIAWYSKENLENLEYVINTVSNGFNVPAALFVTLVIVLVLVEIINIIQAGFLGIIIGHKRNDHKTAFSFLFGFIAYMIGQSVVVLTVLIVGLFDETVMQLFTTNTPPSADILKLLFIICTVVYIAMIVIMKLICEGFLKKGVNVD